MFEKLKIIKRQKEEIESLKQLVDTQAKEINRLRDFEYNIKANCSKGAYECIRHKQYGKVWVSLKRWK